MSPASRHRLLAAALLLVLVAAWLAPEEPGDEGAALATLAPMPDLLDWPSAPASPQLAQSPAKEAADAVAAIAAPPARGSSPPSVAPTDPASDRPASPPTPPFRMFGRMDRDGESIAFIAHGGRTLSAAAGERLPGDWQVDSVGSNGAVLTYLPSGQTALLPLAMPAP